MRPGATGAEEAMAELEALMRAIAGGAMPDRGEATAYSHWRAALLDRGADWALPGFVHQCLTVFKFRDFITLYDPDPAARQGFVTRAFERSRAARGEAGPALRAAGEAGSARRWRF